MENGTARPRKLGFHGQQIPQAIELLVGTYADENLPGPQRHRRVGIQQELALGVTDSKHERPSSFGEGRCLAATAL